MSDAEFENLKKEIRSILITYQKGCSLRDLQREYKNLIGQNLPSSKFNYRCDIDLLYDMPDVVSIREFGNNYHLFGIADENTQHIQNMVVKQKTKGRAPNYRIKPLFPHRSQYTYENYKIPPRLKNPKKFIPPDIAESVIRLIERYPKGLSLRDFLTRYSTGYNEPFSFKDYGYSTLEDCISSIKQISMRTINNDIFIFPLDVKRTPSPREDCPKKVENKNYSEKNPAEKRELESTVDNHRQSCAQKSIPGHIKRNLLKIMELNPDGIWSKSFPMIYKDVSNTVLDYRSLGFSDLYEFVKALPDICRVSQMPSHPNEWMVAPTQSTAQVRTIVYGTGAQAEKPTATSLSQYPESALPIKPSTPQIPAFPQQSRPVNQLVENVPSFTRISQLLLPAPQPSALGVPSSLQKTVNRLADSISSFNQNLESAVPKPQAITPGISAASSPIISKTVNRAVKSILNNEDELKRAASFFKEASPKPSDIQSVWSSAANDWMNYNHNSSIDKSENTDTVSQYTNEYGAVNNSYPIYSSPNAHKMENQSCQTDSDMCSSKNAVLPIEVIAAKIRKILLLQSSGIALEDFFHMYNIHYDDPLSIRDFGFNSIEDFLMSISDQVPLKMTSLEGFKIVEMAQDVAYSMDDFPIPADAVPPTFRFEIAFFKEEQCSQFYTMYTSSILNPDCMYLQMYGEDTSEAMYALYDRMEAFYYSPAGDEYVMHDIHIQAGATCAALWNQDDHWYRVIVKEVRPNDTVKLYYVDYGTVDDVEKSQLRYLKKEYSSLPTQAIECRLTNLKPAYNALSWDPQVKNTMLKLCRDIPLQAYLTHIDQQNFPVFMLSYAINAQEDCIYLNDTLITLRLAEFTKSLERFDYDPTKYPRRNYKQWPYPTTATPAANFALSTPATNFMPSTPATNFTPSTPATIFNPATPVANFVASTPAAIFEPLASSTHVQSSSSAESANELPTCLQPPCPPQGAAYTSHAADFLDETEDTFLDDDDTLFDEMCEQFKMTTIPETLTPIKRVITEDKYFFHILVVEAAPYVSSGDLSFLIWNNKESNQLVQMLQQSTETSIPSLCLPEESYPALFDQIKRFQVKGLQTEDKQMSLLVYPLGNVMAILNIFGHPSYPLRAQVKEETDRFDLRDPAWQNTEEPERAPEFTAETDDEKLHRLCMKDLQIMKEGIRLKLCPPSRLPSLPLNLRDEQSKLQQLLSKVVLRIHQIQNINKLFPI